GDPGTPRPPSRPRRLHELQDHPHGHHRVPARSRHPLSPAGPLPTRSHWSTPMPETLFGVSVTPARDVARVRELAVTADVGGLDLIGVQDHPYAAPMLDAFALIGHLLDHTERIRLFPDVANLPLRPPAMLARTAAALNLISGGRFELGIGAGGYWDAITTMGVPRRTTGEALRALEEAITIVRELWRPDHTVRFDGDHYRVSGTHGADPGSAPIQVWIGAQGPRGLELTGRV